MILHDILPTDSVEASVARQKNVKNSVIRLREF